MDNDIQLMRIGVDFWSVENMVDRVFVGDTCDSFVSCLVDQMLVHRDWILSKIFSPKSLDLTLRFCEIRNGTVVTFRK